MEMTEEIWKRITEDLLIQILARLPMKSIVRFGAVCKSWNEMFRSPEFKQLLSDVAVSSTQAFLIVQGRKQLTSTDPYQPSYVKNLWISTESSYKFDSLSLDFLPSPVVVVAGCKSLLCCWSGKDEIYICNPVTKTWIELPERGGHRSWDFSSVAFNTCTRCCTLIMGRNSTAENMGFNGYAGLLEETIGIGKNSTAMVVGMYHSRTNSWTQLETTADNLVRPRGEGIYSNGKFYWLNEGSHGEGLSIVAFDGERNEWNLIDGPQSLRADFLSHSFGTTFVTGCEGHIVLVCTRGNSVWKLSTDEVEGEKWSPLKTLDDDHELRSWTFCMDVAVNQSGCVLVFLPMINVFAVWSEEGNILQKIMSVQLRDFSDYVCSHISVRAFQVNNICWP